MSWPIRLVDSQFEVLTLLATVLLHDCREMIFLKVLIKGFLI